MPRRPTFLSGAHALLMPIDWPEPFGLVMIEAMACGTPVIAFNRGSVPEIIEDGVTGFIVEDEAEAVAAIRRLRICPAPVRRASSSGSPPSAWPRTISRCIASWRAQPPRAARGALGLSDLAVLRPWDAGRPRAFWASCMGLRLDGPRRLLPHPRRATAMTHPLSVAVAGLGTVGGGVLKLLRDNADIVTARAGRPIAVTAVSARDRTKDRGVPLTGLRWYEDPVALAADPGVDVVVELIGGADGPARALVEAAIAAGKPVVTANKAMLAVHGAALAAAAEAARRAARRSRRRSPAASR